MTNKYFVKLNTLTLVNECSKNISQEFKQEIIRRLSQINDPLFYRFFGVKLYDDTVIDNLQCTNDGKQVIGFIQADYDEFIKRLCRFLNIKKSKFKEANLINELKNKIERLNELAKIISETEDKEKEKSLLISEFPILYKAYLSGHKMLGKAKDLEKARKLAKQYRIYLDLSEYIYSQVNLFRTIIEKLDDYKKLLERLNYNDFIRKYFDEDKVAMYIAYEYLEKARKITNPEEKKEYLKIVGRYISSEYDKTVRINNITFDLIKKNYDEENKDEIIWEVLPSDGYGDILFKYPSKARTITTSAITIEMLKQKGREKEEFYLKNSSKCIGRLIGMTKHKAYVAYFYENGQILLDTEYDDSYPKSSMGDAIYVLKPSEFLNLCQLNKRALRNSDGVLRIRHTLHWRERAQEIIDRKVNIQEADTAKKLIKIFEKNKR